MDFSIDIQTLPESRANLLVILEALRLCDDKAAVDLGAFFEKYLADQDELIDKLARRTAAPAEATPDPTLADLLASLLIEVPHDPPANLLGGCTITLPADTAGRSPKRS